MKILYASSEALPFAASGGLAEVAGSLPKAIRNLGTACRVVLPLYSQIQQKYSERLEFVCEFTVHLAWRNQPCAIYRLTEGGVVHYFVKNDYYFFRERMYGDFDDGERFAFFSKAVLDMLEPIGFQPDVIHCNDWQTALIAPLLRLFYHCDSFFEKIRTVFTIHNVRFQGKYGMEFVSDVLGIPTHLAGAFEYDGCCNLMKTAIEQSDLITTVSPGYAVELLDPWYSFGMDRMLSKEREKLFGILNGLDTTLYDPETDPYIAKNFSAEKFTGKAACKKALLEEFSLPESKKPLIAMVTRMTDQKGLDLVSYIFDELMQRDINFIILGSGEQRYVDFFNEAQRRYPEKAGVYIGFNHELSHRIYAGSDIFLMPSATEPCGIAQMISMRYGTVPVVRLTGGLRDTVTDVGSDGCGYTFATYNAHDMLYAIDRALDDYSKKRGWNQIAKRCMQEDFTWKGSAKKYVELYKRLAD